MCFTLYQWEFVEQLINVARLNRHFDVFSVLSLFLFYSWAMMRYVTGLFMRVASDIISLKT